MVDQGIGIPPDAAAQLFRAYFRHEEAKRMTGEGMGIGLYISKQFVAAHGGRIWVDSAVGQGSAFYVALPLADAAVPVPER